MRDPNRIDITLEEIKKIWKKYPDLRLGQLILNVIPESYLYYTEDDDLLRAIKQGYKK